MLSLRFNLLRYATITWRWIGTNHPPGPTKWSWIDLASLSIRSQHRRINKIIAASEMHWTYSNHRRQPTSTQQVHPLKEQHRLFGVQGTLKRFNKKHHLSRSEQNPILEIDAATKFITANNALHNYHRNGIGSASASTNTQILGVSLHHVTYSPPRRIVTSVHIQQQQCPLGN